MRYLLLLLLIGPLSGCLAFDDLFCADEYNSCGGPPVYGTAARATAEPPTIVQAGAVAPAQTREPPR